MPALLLHLSIGSRLAKPKPDDKYTKSVELEDQLSDAWPSPSPSAPPLGFSSQTTMHTRPEARQRKPCSSVMHCRHCTVFQFTQGEPLESTFKAVNVCTWTTVPSFTARDHTMVGIFTTMVAFSPPCQWLWRLEWAECQIFWPGQSQPS